MNAIDTKDYIPQTIYDDNYLLIDENIKFILIVQEDLIDKVDFSCTLG